MIAGFRCAGTGRLVKAGVSMTHMHVMWLLQHHGDLPMSRLAELLDVSFSNATGIIDRMEERGLVERVRVPDDRRVVLVRIAPKRLEALEEIEAIKQDRLQAILGHLDAAQLDRVARRPSTTSAARSSPSSAPTTSPATTTSTTRRPQEGTSDLMEAIPAESGRYIPTLDEDPGARPAATGRSSRSSSPSCSGCSSARSTRPSSAPALPTIVTDLGGNDLYIWVVTIYLLTSTISVPVLRQAVRPLRPQADADDRHHALPDRLGPVRPAARTWSS